MTFIASAYHRSREGLARGVNSRHGHARSPAMTRWLMFAIAACGAPAMPLGNASRGAVPRGDATLAVFEPEGNGCVLRRRDPAAATADDVARFDHDCRGARIAWRDDLERAVVWFDPHNLYAAGYNATGAPKASRPDEEATIESTSTTSISTRAPCTW
jgi:hypothetical protein